MKAYRHNADAAFGAVLVSGATVCSLIMLASVGYPVVASLAVHQGHPPRVLPWVLRVLQFAPVVAMSFYVRQRLRQGKLPTWCYIAFLLCVLITFGAANAWFMTPMHDIALLFGSHGRWGCQVLGADGSRMYFVRDTTVPWMIFGPMAIAGIGHWAWFRRQTNTEPVGPANGSQPLRSG